MNTKTILDPFEALYKVKDVLKFKDYGNVRNWTSYFKTFRKIYSDIEASNRDNYGEDIVTESDICELV